ncbi:hypothetical protein BC628DRAFT_739945 [Trametes gibbosa]|nr:hypothetical protein BC628DRAFT_739945 [Trametes gibbosa]
MAVLLLGEEASNDRTAGVEAEEEATSTPKNWTNEGRGVSTGGGCEGRRGRRGTHRGAVIWTVCGSGECRNRPESSLSATECLRECRGSMQEASRPAWWETCDRQTETETGDYQEGDRTVSELPAVRPSAALAEDVGDVQDLKVAETSRGLGARFRWLHTTQAAAVRARHPSV